MFEIDKLPLQIQEKISKEDVNRLLDLGRLLKSVLTEEEVSELINEIQKNDSGE